MQASERKESERYYRTYQRSMVVGLIFVLSLGVWLMVQVFRPGYAAGFGGALVAVYLIGLYVMQRIALRGRRWRTDDPEVQKILRDEWRVANYNRAFQVGFWVMFWAQIPLMFLMTYLPPEPSPRGVSFLTLTLGLGSFFASYLYFSRQQSDD